MEPQDSINYGSVEEGTTKETEETPSEIGRSRGIEASQN